MPRSDATDTAAAWKRFSAGAEPGLSASVPFESCFRKAAADHGLPVALLVAVARGESNFDPDAVSSANARGLMQIQWPGTGRHLGFDRVTDLHVPCRNVDAGARYLKELLERYRNDLHLALAAYNYGPGRISSDRDLPAGAEWYSAYIYRHLQYVLGDGGVPSGDREWSVDRQMELAVFRAPYRAEAFMETLQKSAAPVRLDWFRQDVGRFRVVMLYASRAERATGLRRLAAAGFPLSGAEDDG
jgi:hypothetical protein